MAKSNLPRTVKGLYKELILIIPKILSVILVIFILDGVTVWIHVLDARRPAFHILTAVICRYLIRDIYEIFSCDVSERKVATQFNPKNAGAALL